jgi:hypothetical protein
VTEVAAPAKLRRVDGRAEKPTTVRTQLEELETVVSELRAQTGVEAFELRARVRELERRIEALAASDGSSAEARTPKGGGGKAGAAKGQAQTRAAAARRKRAKEKARHSSSAEGSAQET